MYKLQLHAPVQRHTKRIEKSQIWYFFSDVWCRLRDRKFPFGKTGVNCDSRLRDGHRATDLDLCHLVWQHLNSDRFLINYCNALSSQSPLKEIKSQLLLLSLRWSNDAKDKTLTKRGRCLSAAKSKGLRRNFDYTEVATFREQSQV